MNQLEVTDPPKSYLPLIGTDLPVNAQDRLTKRLVTGYCRVVSYAIKPGMRGYPAMAELLDNKHTKVVLKFPNLSDDLSPRDLRERTDQFNNDVQREMDAWNRLQFSKARSHIAIVYGSGSYACEINDVQQHISYFAQEYVEGKTLDDWCSEHFDDPFRGIQDTAAWFKLARKLLEVLGWIHQERVIHADIRHTNIMIRSRDNEPVFIDFGQAWRLDQMGIAESQNNIAYAYYAPERHKNADSHWYQPADIYSICGLLYYLATGENPPLTAHFSDNEPPKPISKTETKKKVVEAIQRINPALYLANIGIPDIILYGLRPLPHERAIDTDEIIEVLDYYRDAFQDQNEAQAPIGNVSEETLRDQITQLNFLIKQLQAKNNQILYRLLRRDLRYLEAQVTNIVPNDRKHLRTLQRSQLFILRSGDRDELVKQLLAALSGLHRGDRIFALTTSIFWQKNNFGANGRLLTMIKMAAIHGISVRWILLIEEDEWAKRHEKKEDGSTLKKILEAQQEAMREVHQIANIDITSQTPETSGFYFGWRLISEEERGNIINKARTFILISEHNGKGNDDLIAILPTYTHQEGRIASVRLWRHPIRWQHEWQNLFVENLQKSINVCDFDDRRLI